MHVLLDILIAVAAYALAWLIVISGRMLPLDKGVLKPQVYFMALIFIAFIHLILYTSPHLYVPKRVQGRRSELANICKVNVIGLMFFTFVLLGPRRFISYLSCFSTKMIPVFFVASIILLEAEWTLMHISLRSLRTNGYSQKYVLLVGYNRMVKRLTDRVSVSPEQGYHVQEIPNDHRPAGFVYRKVRVLGSINRPGDFLASNTLDEIAITLSIKGYSNLERIVAARERSGVHIKLIPDCNNIIPAIPYMGDLQGFPVIHIRHVPLIGVSNATMKRIVGLVDALFGLIVFLPLILVAAPLIKTTLSGPMLFSQEGIGLHNRPFKTYKFRSMEVRDPGRKRSQRTTPHDPRVTPVGRFIRKTNTDEVPQSFNVLISNMSLMGPRPERPLFTEELKEEIPQYMIKHQVCLGFTGWAQVDGYCGDTSITRRTEYDLYYIENWSLGSDFKIMSLTVFKGLTNKSTHWYA